MQTPSNDGWQRLAKTGNWKARRATPLHGSTLRAGFFAS